MADHAREAISMRNSLIHGDDGVDGSLVADTVRHGLPPLVGAAGTAIAAESAS